MNVRLTDAQKRLVWEEAERKYRRYEGAPHRWGKDSATHTVAIEAAAMGAEMAVAVALNREWAKTPGPDYDGDGGMVGIQVRYTPWPEGRLLLHDEDDDQQVYFLVTGHLDEPGYNIVGFIVGLNGKRLGQVQELQPGRPCIVVDRRHLTALGTPRAALDVERP